MRETPPTTEPMKASDARQNFASVINEVARREKRVLVEKSGVPVAAIVSARDLRRLENLDVEIQQAWDAVEAMRKAFEGVPPEEIERETERIMAEIKEENRRKRARAAAGE